MNGSVPLWKGTPRACPLSLPCENPRKRSANQEERPPRDPGLLALSPWTSRLQNHEKWISVVDKPPSYGIFLQAPDLRHSYMTSVSKGNQRKQCGEWVNGEQLQEHREILILLRKMQQAPQSRESNIQVGLKWRMWTYPAERNGKQQLSTWEVWQRVMCSGIMRSERLARRRVGGGWRRGRLGPRGR